MSAEVVSLNWTPWVRTAVAFSPGVLRELLDGGQSFRWHQEADGAWLGAWGECVVRLKIDGEQRLQWSAPVELASRVESELPSYLGEDRDFPALVDSLPWRSDPHLARALVDFTGLRILRQPFGETLLCFLCSATKQIVQIKQMTRLLATKLGEKTVEGFYQLPTWEELARVEEKALRECLLGFRARHIAATARFLAQRPGWLSETEQLLYEEAKTRLLELPGVGEKVADCVLLFGAGRLEAFPVDVWITRTMSHRYGLTGWSPAQVAHFGRRHFGPYAGLAQQFLFAYERKHRAEI